MQGTVRVRDEGRQGERVKVKWRIEKLTGGRKQIKKEYEYEVQFVGMDYNSNLCASSNKLAKWGFEKHMKVVDEKVAQRMGAFATPLTNVNVEKHLEDVGLDKEFGTHTRMAALSGGQKVKVVIAAAMWNQPHIVILDEPTNYLDRDSLGALAGAIEVFEGGVVMITHNNEFCSALCPETWLMQKADDGIARCNCKGDAEWMAKQSKKAGGGAIKMDEVTDALGNVVEIKEKKKSKDKMSRAEKKKADKIKKAKLARGESRHRLRGRRLGLKERPSAAPVRPRTTRPARDDNRDGSVTPRRCLFFITERPANPREHLHVVTRRNED